METAKKFFDKCDADGSGKIRKCEVYNVLKQFKSHDEAIQFMAVSSVCVYVDNDRIRVIDFFGC